MYQLWTNYQLLTDHGLLMDQLGITIFCNHIHRPLASDHSQTTDLWNFLLVRKPVNGLCFVNRRDTFVSWGKYCDMYGEVTISLQP